MGSGGLKFQFIKDLRQQAPYPRINCPVVLVHALDDPDVSVATSFNFIRMHARLGLPVQAHILQSADPKEKLDHGLYHFAKPGSNISPNYKDILEQFFLEKRTGERTTTP